MNRKIFVNLPVNDLSRSMRFFEALGWSFNRQFTDETAACLVITDDIYAMLLTHAKFQEFTPKAICDSTVAAEVLVCLSCQSRDEVDQLTEKAFAAGGTSSGPSLDYGFMYGRSFQDLDSHIWELVWMDPNHVQPK
jgi:predicted lactoylglutathione lyase